MDKTRLTRRPVWQSVSPHPEIACRKTRPSICRAGRHQTKSAACRQHSQRLIRSTARGGPGGERATMAIHVQCQGRGLQVCDLRIFSCMVILSK